MQRCHLLLINPVHTALSPIFPRRLVSKWPVWLVGKLTSSSYVKPCVHHSLVLPALGLWAARGCPAMPDKASIEARLLGSRHVQWGSKARNCSSVAAAAQCSIIWPPE